MQFTLQVPREAQSAAMEVCHTARIINLGNLVKGPQNLWRLLLRVLSRLLPLPPSLLKKFPKKEHDRPPPTETPAVNLPELPQDMLMEIFALLEIPDLVRAGSVCNSWHSAYKELRCLGQYKQSQTPCLLYTTESAGDSAVCLYSLVERRVYKLTLPEPPIRSRFMIGSSLGWLVTVDNISEMHLVNPITGEQIALPSVITIEHVKPIFNETGSLHQYEFYSERPSILRLDELRDYLHFKAFVFSETSTGSYLVVLIHHPYCQLSFARVGDDKWTWLPPHRGYEDCTYKDGLLYAVTGTGTIHAYDLSCPIVTRKIIMGEVHYFVGPSMYIMEAPWGGMMYVYREPEDDEDHMYDDPATFVNNTGKIEIYSVDTMAKECVEIKDLHNHVLFLGHIQSLCLSSEEYPHLKANCAYFTDDNEVWLLACRNNRRDIGLFDLKNNKKDELVSPQLWSNWPAPVWITPSFRKMEFGQKE